MENYEIGDSRLKTDLKPIENVLDGISTVKTYEHGYEPTKIPNQKKYYGLIAQELEKEFPLLIEEKFKVENDKIQYKTIDHNQLIAVMVRAINQLNEKIDNLQEEINENKNG